MHPLSTKVNGKDWRITCNQKLNLVYALHSSSKCKSRVICMDIEETVLPNVVKHRVQVCL